MAKPTEAEHPQLSVVVWDDAWCDATAVVTLKDAHDRHMPTVMQTLGWVLVDNEKGISIANERCLDLGDESYRGRTFIPRSLLKSVTPFKLTTPRKRALHAKDPALPDPILPFTAPT